MSERDALLSLCSVANRIHCFPTGNKMERILSAKRKENAEVFILSKPESVLNPQPPAVFPDQERACSSKHWDPGLSGLGVEVDTPSGHHDEGSWFLLSLED